MNTKTLDTTVLNALIEYLKCAGIDTDGLIVSEAIQLNLSIKYLVHSKLREIRK